MPTRPINNADFQPECGFGPRLGSDVDVKNLENLFKYLGFQVFVHQNLGHSKIKQCIQTFKEMFEDVSVDMCIVCVMSHGNKGKLVDIDGVEMSANKDIIMINLIFTTLNGTDLTFEYGQNTFEKGIKKNS